MPSEYDQKFDEMKKYIPFLESMIKRLESTSSTSSKPRLAQLDKIRSLRDLLLDKKKRMKMENLLKCEQVLINLYAKVEQRDSLPGMNKKSENVFHVESPTAKEKKDLDHIRTKLRAVTKLDDDETLPEIVRANQSEESTVGKEPALFQRRPNKSPIRYPTSSYNDAKLSPKHNESSSKRSYTRILVSPEASPVRRQSDVSRLFKRRSPKKSSREYSPSVHKRDRKKPKPRKVKDLNITLNVPEESLNSLNTEDILTRIINCSDNDVDIDTLRELRSQILDELKDTGSNNDISELLLKSCKSKNESILKNNEEIEEGEISDSESEAIESIYGSIVVVDKDNTTNEDKKPGKTEAPRKIQICLVISSDTKEYDTNQSQNKKVDISNCESLDKVASANDKEVKLEALDKTNRAQPQLSESKRDSTKVDQIMNKQDNLELRLQGTETFEKIGKCDESTKGTDLVNTDGKPDKEILNKSNPITSHNTPQKNLDTVQFKANFYKPLNDEEPTEKTNAATLKGLDKDEEVVQNTQSLEVDTKIVHKPDTPTTRIDEIFDKSKPESIPLLDEPYILETPVKKSIVSEIDILQALKNDILSESLAIPGSETVTPPLHQPKLIKVASAKEIISKNRISIEKYKEKSVSTTVQNMFKNESEIKSKSNREPIKKTKIKLTEKECERFNLPSKISLNEDLSSEDEYNSDILVEDVYGDLVPRSPDDINIKEMDISPPIIIPEDPVKAVIIPKADIDMRTLPPITSPSPSNDSDSCTMQERNDKLLRNINNETKKILLDPRMRKELVKEDPTLTNLETTQTASFSNPNRTPVRTPNSRSYEMTPNRHSLEVDSSSRRKHVYAPCTSSFDTYGNNDRSLPKEISPWERTISPDLRKVEWEMNKEENWDRVNRSRYTRESYPAKRMEEPQYPKGPIIETYKIDRREKFRTDQSTKSFSSFVWAEKPTSFSRLDAPLTPVSGFGRSDISMTSSHCFGRSDGTTTHSHAFGRSDSPSTSNNNYARSDYCATPSHPFGRSDCPTTPSHPFGRSDCPTTPSHPFGRSDCPTTPSHPFGRSDCPTTPSHPFGRSDCPTTPSHPFGRSDCPTTPSHPFGRSDCPTTPIHPFGRSDCPTTPIHPFGRSDCPSTPSHPFGRSDCPTTPIHPFGRSEGPSSHPYGKVDFPVNDIRSFGRTDCSTKTFEKSEYRQNSGRKYLLEDPVWIPKDDREINKYRDRSYDRNIYNSQNRYSDSDFRYQQRDIRVDREDGSRYGEQSRFYKRNQRPECRGNSQRTRAPLIETIDECSRSYEDFRSTTNPGERVDRYNPNDPRSTQRASSVGRNIYDENYQNKTLCVQRDVGRSFKIDTSVNTTFQNFLSSKGLEINDQCFNARRSRAASVGRSLNRESSVGRSLVKPLTSQVSIPTFNNNERYRRASSVGRDLVTRNGKNDKSLKDIKADFIAFKDKIINNDKKLHQTKISDTDQPVTNRRSRWDSYDKNTKLAYSPRKNVRDPRVNRGNQDNRKKTISRESRDKTSYGIIYSSDNISKGTALRSGSGVKNYKIPKLKSVIEEKEREQKLKREKEEQERKEKEEKERLKREKEEQEIKEKEEKERLKREKEEQEHKEKLKKEKQARKEKEEKERRLQEEKERKEQKQKIEGEVLELEKKEKTERERKEAKERTCKEKELEREKSELEMKNNLKAKLSSININTCIENKPREEANDEQSEKQKNTHSTTTVDEISVANNDESPNSKRVTRSQSKIIHEDSSDKIKPKRLKKSLVFDSDSDYEDYLAVENKVRSPVKSKKTSNVNPINNKRSCYNEVDFQSTFEVDELEIFGDNINIDPVKDNINALIADLDNDIDTNKSDSTENFKNEINLETMLENISSAQETPKYSINNSLEISTEKDSPAAISTEVKSESNKSVVIEKDLVNSEDKIVNKELITEQSVSTSEVTKLNMSPKKTNVDEKYNSNDSCSTPDSTIANDVVLEKPKELNTTTNYSNDSHSDVTSTLDTIESSTKDNIESSSSQKATVPLDSIESFLSILKNKSKIKELLTMLGEADDGKVKRKLEKLSELVWDDEDNDDNSNCENELDISNAESKSLVENNDSRMKENQQNENEISIDQTNVSDSRDKVVTQESIKTDSIHNINENKSDQKTLQNTAEEDVAKLTSDAFVVGNKIELLESKSGNVSNNVKQDTKTRKAGPNKNNISLKELKKKLIKSNANEIEEIKDHNDKPKRRNELQKLQEDIQEMFTSDILNSTGIRMCRLAKMVNINDNEQKEDTGSLDPKPIVVLNKHQETDKNKGMPSIKLRKTSVPKSKQTSLVQKDNKTKRVMQKSGPKSKTQSLRSEVSDPYEFETDSLVESIATTENESEAYISGDEMSLASSCKSVSSNDVLTEVRKKKRKRGSWQTGMIPNTSGKSKHKKKQEVQIPDDNVYEFIVPKRDILMPDLNCFVDKTYCFQKNLETYSCRLCVYTGRDIIFHYKQKHPHNEIPLSRFNPQTAKEAIQLSDSIDFRAFSNIPSKSYTCGFCHKIFWKSKALLEKFFWHVVSMHTGEYKQTCSVCVDTGKCPLKLDIPLPPKDVQGQLVGYICEKCNYTQISLENLKTHILVRHNGEEIALYAINLSVMSKKRLNSFLKRCEATKARTLRSTRRSNQSLAEASDDNTDNNSDNAEHNSDFNENNTDNAEINSDSAENISDNAENNRENAENNRDNAENNRDNTENNRNNADDESDKQTTPQKPIFASPLKSKETDSPISLKQMQSKITFETEDGLSNIEQSNVLVKMEFDQNNVFSDMNDVDNPVEQEPATNTQENDSTIASTDITAVAHFKISYTETGSIEYVCCINGDVHFKATKLISLKQHARKHPEDWDGYCIICKVIVKPQGVHNFNDCLQHYIDMHMDDFPVYEQTHSADHATISTSKASCSIQKPYINVRPLADLIPKTAEPEYCTRSPIIKNVISLTEPPRASPTYPSMSQEKKPEKVVKYEEWQRIVMSKKHRVVLAAMMAKRNLIKTFKCAGRYCSFASDDVEEALLHASTHQRIGGEGAMDCLYCDFDTSNNYIDLVKHVFNVHGRCQYSCGQCFYRAAASQLVGAHIAGAHPDCTSEGNVLRTTNVITPSGLEEVQVLPREKAVRYYACVQDIGGNKSHGTLCSFRTYTPGKFCEHLVNKHEAPYFCSECKESFLTVANLIAHMKGHGLMLYQCTWCVHGAEKEPDLIAHVAAKHPDKQPQAYIRIITNKDGTSEYRVLPLAYLNKSKIPTEDVTPSKSDDPIREADRALELEKLINQASMSFESIVPVEQSKEPSTETEIMLTDVSTEITEQNIALQNVHKIASVSEASLTSLTSECTSRSSPIPNLQAISTAITTPSLAISTSSLVAQSLSSPQNIPKHIDVKTSVKIESQQVTEVVLSDSDEDLPDVDASDDVINVSDDDNEAIQSDVTYGHILLKCPGCKAVFVSMKGFMKHVLTRKHARGSIRCPHSPCHQSVNSLNELLNHYLFDHAKNNDTVKVRFKCAVCDKFWKSLPVIKKHLMNDHGVVKMWGTCNSFQSDLFVVGAFDSEKSLLKSNLKGDIESDSSKSKQSALGTPVSSAATSLVTSAMPGTSTVLLMAPVAQAASSVEPSIEPSTSVTQPPSVDRSSLDAPEPVEPVQEPTDAVVSESEEDPKSDVIDISDDDPLSTVLVDIKKLFLCPKCHNSFKTGGGFHRHITHTNHVHFPVNCPHKPCKDVLNSPMELSLHYKSDHMIGMHEKDIFNCTKCKTIHRSLNRLKCHMKAVHGITCLQFKQTKKKGVYNVFDKTDIQSPVQSPTKIPTNQTIESQKEVYSPEEIDQLPIKPILDKSVRCLLCLFNTKVRLNMVRHLQSHLNQQQVPQTEPVNPVPHLDTHEKHFDKMVNLASSSIMNRVEKQTKPDNPPASNVPLEAAANYPKYVPERQRLTCGAKDCSYISVDEAMLKCHWETLHSGTNDYHCVHCPPYQNLDTSRPITALRVITHLKMHDVTLYACSSCSYYHYLKNMVEKHIDETHKEASVMVVREEVPNAPPPAATASSIPPAPTMDLKPWQCGLCKYKSLLHPQVVEHCSRLHNSKMQFRCGYCPFRTSTLESVSKHQTNSHSGKPEDVFYYYYREGSLPDEPDGTPRWMKQRKKMPEQAVKVEVPDGSPSEPEPIPTTSHTVDLNKVKKEVEENTGEMSVEELCKRYGSFCEPNGLRYKCSFCTVVNLDQREAMESHLYEELHYRKWGCGLCPYKAFHLDGLKEHMAAEHRPKWHDAIKLPIDANLEKWVQEYLDHQSVYIRNSKKILDELKKSSAKAVESRPTTPKQTEPQNVQYAHEDLIKAFGEFGHASENKFCCPKCDFVSTENDVIRGHLENEIGKIRWKCSSCSESFLNFHQAQGHCRSTHPTGSAKPMAAARQQDMRTAWVNAVIETQKQSMAISDSQETSALLEQSENSLLVVRYEESVSEQDTSLKRKRHSTDSDDDSLVIDEPESKRKSGNRCRHCAFTSKYSFNLFYHELRHFNLFPNTCSYCTFNGSKHHMFYHFKNCHPNLAVKYKPTEMPDGPPIRRVVATPSKFKDTWACLQCERVVSKKDMCNHFHDYEMKPEFSLVGSFVLKCCICRVLCLDMQRLEEHHNAVHPDIPMNYALHELGVGKDGLRCDTCGKSFKVRKELMVHKHTEHGATSDDVPEVSGVKRVARKSTTKLPKAAFAKKSTTKLPNFVESEYSFYGTKPSLSEYENVTTFIPFNNKRVLFTIKQLNELININPIVELTDVDY